MRRASRQSAVIWCLLAGFFLLAVGAATALHGDHDHSNVEHDTCVVCVLKHQPTVADESVTPTPAVVLSARLKAVAPRRVTRQQIRSWTARGPPAVSL